MTQPEVTEARICTRVDLPEVIALVDNAMREGSDQTMLTDYPLVFRDENLPNIRVGKVDGQVVSVVPFIPRPVVMDGCHFTIGIISPTATHPDHQHKGYGLGCLQSSIKGMKQEGCDLSVLWTLVPTFPFYEHGDYQGISNQGWTWRCSNEDASLFTDHGEDIVTYSPTTLLHLDAIQSMRQQEIFGIHRTLEEYAALLNLPKMETWIALRGDVPVGYLVVSHAANKPGPIEAGGDRSAVETMVRRLLSSLPPGGHTLAHGNMTPSTLGDLLAQKMPGRKEVGGGNMMVRINDVPGFFQRIAPWLEKRNGGVERQLSVVVTDSGDVVGFRFTKAGLHLSADALTPRLEMTRRELTSVVFGPHPDRPVETPAVLRDLFPFYFPIWVLDRS